MGLTTNVIRGRQASRLLLLAHGLGADERDLAALVPHLDPEGHFLAVLPRGPYAAPPGFAWFRFEGGPGLVAGTFRSSLDALEEALEDALLQHGMDRAEAVVGGFSQGASLALALGLRRTDRPRPAGVLVMSGFLVEVDTVGYDWGAEDLPPVLMQHGTYDPLIPVDRAREIARRLEGRGVPVTYREYPMAHEATLQSLRDARAWLEEVRAGARPRAPVPAEGEGAGDGGLVRSVTSATFEEEVLRSPKPVIVDFWAPWCQPCRMVSPVVEEIARMRRGTYKVVKVNIDEAPDIAQRYQIQSIPLVALFRNGRLERRSVGAKPRQQIEAELGMLVIP